MLYAAFGPGSAPHLLDEMFALAVFSPERAQQPDVPTVTELGLPESTFSGWYAVALFQGTPAEVRVFRDVAPCANIEVD